MSDDTDVTTRPNDLESQPTNDTENPPASAGLDPLDATDSPDGALEAAGERELEAEDEGGDAVDDSVEDSGEDSTDDSSEDSTEESGGARRGGSRVRLLEREGEVAADFLERLLDIADLDGDIEVDIDGDRASVAIVDSEDGRVPRRMVGADGKVLDALQELTRLAVQAETGERSRLMLDIAGHRAARRAVVVEIAQTAIAEVKTTGAQKALEDMSAFERKIVHDEVAAAGLGSESEGVEPHRHIIVFPA